MGDTYASWLVKNSVNLKIDQELPGHEDIKTTLIYAHLAPDNKLAATKILDAVMPGEEKTNLIPFAKKEAR